MTDETYSVSLASQVEKISCVIGYNYWFIFVIIKFVMYVTKNGGNSIGNEKLFPRRFLK